MQQPAICVLESPSFNGYSSNRLTEIAARVVNQQHDDPVFDSTNNATDTEQREQKKQVTGHENGREDLPVTDVAQEELQADVHDDSFEFSVVRENEQSSLSADEIIQFGHIKTSFPLFNTDLINTATNWTIRGGGCNDEALATEARVSESTSSPPTLRLTLKKLLIQEVESEANELDRIPPGTYCIWTPKNSDRHEIARKKKRKSDDGLSKRWKIREIFGWIGGAGVGGDEGNEATRKVVVP